MRKIRGRLRGVISQHTAALRESDKPKPPFFESGTHFFPRGTSTLAPKLGVPGLLICPQPWNMAQPETSRQDRRNSVQTRWW